MRANETSHYQTLSLGSDPALRRRHMVVSDQLHGNLRFGLLLETLDLVAEFYSEARVVTAAIDDIFVRNAADVNRDISFQARINHVGRSSLVIGIRVEQPGEPANHIASCHFTMVARSWKDGEEFSVALPPLEYLDENEQRRGEKAVSSREEYREQQALISEPPSREEYTMLKQLHLAQEEQGFAGLRAGKLIADSWERMYPEQENVPQKIFGGYLIRRAYELSSIASELVAPNRAIIAAVNRINFFRPVRLGDKLHYTSRIVYTSDSFVCVEANIERISRDRSSKALSNSCLFTFANVDNDLNHLPVPPIYPATYAEDDRYLAAHRSFRALVEHHAII